MLPFPLPAPRFWIISNEPNYYGRRIDYDLEQQQYKLSKKCGPKRGRREKIWARGRVRQLQYEEGKIFIDYLNDLPSS